MNTKYVTLAIHTYDRAVAMRDFLLENNIEAELENVNIESPAPSCGVRVRIPEAKLPKALMLLESERDKAEAEIAADMSGEMNNVLVPVDFTSSNPASIKIAFAFAAANGLKPVLLHVYTTPYFDGSLSLTDNFTLDINDAQVRKDLRSAAVTRMDRLAKQIDELIKSGKLPDVRYTTQIREGIPEDVILDYARTTPPKLIVMGTRAVAKKSAQMLGSVAAEVVDSCRVPVFTVPEDFDFTGFASLNPAVFFCNVNQQDIIAMDIFITLMGKQRELIHLFPVIERNSSKTAGRLADLQKYFSQRYPDHEFRIQTCDGDDARKALDTLAKREDIKLLIVPNKKKNVFARLFSPGIPHKVIFEADAPMLALPV